MNVEKDWGETMNRFKFIGVFPITEDLQPGDVVLDVPPEEGADPQPQRQRLGSMSKEMLTAFLGQFADQEATRMRFEGTKVQAAAGAGGAGAETARGLTMNATTTALPRTATATVVRAAAGTPQGNAGRGAGRRRGPAANMPDPSAPAAAQVLDAETAPPVANTPRLRRVALPGIIAARVEDW